nr:hypothetical protein BaRGS_034772 [Batillaria attramentaria]
MQNSEAHMVVVISKELRTVEKLIRETVAMGGRFLWLESGIYPDDLEVYGSDSFVELIFGSIAVTCPKTDVSDYESFFMNRTGKK